MLMGRQTLQLPDRRRAGDLAQDGQRPRLEHPWQAGGRYPGRGGRARASPGRRSCIAGAARARQCLRYPSPGI
jgi:hypothetical protein